MDEFLLIENIEEVKDNIKQFNIDIKSNEEMRKRFLSHYRQWYYIKELDMFAPSKFIGYKNMNAQRYNNKDGKGADGRKTEAVLRQWFEKIELPELLDELQQRMGKYGKIKKTAEIHIMKNELPLIESAIKKNEKGVFGKFAEEKLEVKQIITDFKVEVPAIRLLPMSESDPEFTGKLIEDLQEWFVNELPYREYNFKKGMNAESGTLVLFQYKGHVIASAILEEKIMYEEESEGGYRGAYYFNPTSIAIFTPITSKEMKNIWTEFKGFNQSQQELDVRQYQLWSQLLLNKDFRYVLDKDTDEETFQREMEKSNANFSKIVVDKPKEIIKGTHIITPITKWKRNPVVSKNA